ncbi:MAG: hypothetical protein GAK34_00795 [Delftia tsuruhatensis]|nr:MAG: hypothetical protein GAK34_00795 [Delftia tsuruhatensis]
MPTPLRSFSADSSFVNCLTETLVRMVDGGTG